MLFMHVLIALTFPLALVVVLSLATLALLIDSFTLPSFARH